MPNIYIVLFTKVTHVERRLISIPAIICVLTLKKKSYLVQSLGVKYSIADVPAAWTTRPRVVVIFEEAALADSGSKPDKNKSRQIVHTFKEVYIESQGIMTEQHLHTLSGKNCVASPVGRLCKQFAEH